MRMKRLVLTTVLPVSNAESTAASEERQNSLAREKAVRPRSSRALTNGPVAPGSSLAFRETTLSESQLLANRWPPRLYGRGSGNCRDDNPTIRQGRKS